MQPQERCKIDYEIIYSNKQIIIKNQNNYKYKQKIDQFLIRFQQLDFVIQNIKKISKNNQNNLNTFQQGSNCHKTILNNLHGQFKTRKINAIIGASGAGKSTLLDILACKLTQTRGKFYLNGQSYDDSNFYNFGAYLVQNNLFVETMTVLQSLWFNANLRLTQKDQIKQQKIKQLVKTFKLQNCLNTYIGGFLLKGISGGQKKRLAIACEALHNPDVFILDEPTSGLDSLTSLLIINFLQKLAHVDGKTIILTIHQPNNQIFDKIDNLFLLAKGQIVYNGPAKECRQYFQKKTNLFCSQYLNKAQYIQICLDRVESIENPQTLQKINNKNIQQTNNQIIKYQPKQKIELNWFYVLKILFLRQLNQHIRNPLFLIGILVQIIVISIFIGGLYFNIGSKNFTQITSWSSIKGFTFFVSFGGFSVFVLPYLILMSKQKQIYIKQEYSKLYSASHYFISKLIVCFIYIFIIPLIFIIISGFMANIIDSFSLFFKLYIAGILLNLGGLLVGFIIGLASPSIQSGIKICSILIFTTVVFTGMMKNRGNYSPWYGWIQYLSITHYVFNALLYLFTQNRVSLINQLNFNMNYWQSIGLLFVQNIILLFCGFLTLKLIPRKAR